MSTASDRRALGASRIPFEAMVEVGGALGPSFEAQAVNLSEEGMQLRTAYLPEVGQPVSCRFDAGHGLVVVASGEVLWKEDMGHGGEFGIRFTNLDSASASALQRILGMVDDGAAPRGPLGRKVRLHIEGLASPMRARVKEMHGSSVKAFSELGFLRVGKHLDLEDAATGSKRPALIDRVEVEIDEGSRIPQLVVGLRYDDAQPASMMHEGRERTPEPQVLDDGVCSPATSEAGVHASEDIDVQHEPVEGAPAASAPLGASRSPALDDEPFEGEPSVNKMKSPLANRMAKVAPAFEGWAKRARTTLALLAARRKGGTGDDVEVPIRRTTAPAPGGGLHASGRKVVRGELRSEPEIDRFEEAPAKAKVSKKKLALVGAVGVAAVLALVAMRKPAEAPPPVAAAPAEPAPPAPPPAPVPAPPPVAPAPTSDSSLASTDPADLPDHATEGKHKKGGKVQSFGSGNVTHGNVLRLKMDGAIEKIQGASQPAGFTVVIPNRKSLDAGGPLAAKDSRLAGVHVSNEASGAELTVSFKDGVPPYLVRARGEVLEIVLARPGGAEKAPEAHAKKRHHKKH